MLAHSDDEDLEPDDGAPTELVMSVPQLRLGDESAPLSSSEPPSDAASATQHKSLQFASGPGPDGFSLALDLVDEDRVDDQRVQERMPLRLVLREEDEVLERVLRLQRLDGALVVEHGERHELI